MSEIKRFEITETDYGHVCIRDKTDDYLYIITPHLEGLMNELASENEQLKQLADGNEEQLLKVMSYLHDNHYELWEKVNKECFDD